MIIEKIMQCVHNALLASYCFGLKYYQISDLHADFIIQKGSLSILFKKRQTQSNDFEKISSEDIFFLLAQLENILKKCEPSLKNNEKNLESFMLGAGNLNSEDQFSLINYKLNSMIEHADLIQLMIFAKRNIMQAGGVFRITLEQTELVCPKFS
jgi:hypothetical protein